GHASRLVHAQPQLDPLQPASLPMLATLRAGFWRRGGTLSCWLRVVNRCGFTFIRAPERCSFPHWLIAVQLTSGWPSETLGDPNISAHPPVNTNPKPCRKQDGDGSGDMQPPK